MVCLNCYLHDNLIIEVADTAPISQCPVCKCTMVRKSPNLERSCIVLANEKTFWDEELTVGELVKNKREKVIIKQVKRDDVIYNELRIYYLDGDTYLPSKKGIVLSRELMLKAMELLKETLEVVPQ